MTEIEVPLEKVQEDMHHALHHGEGGAAAGFMGRAALLSAFLAVLAAVAALFAGHFANEAMIEQLQSSDQWAYFQAKGIKRVVSELRAELKKSEDSQDQVEAYREEQEEIRREAELKEKESKAHLRQHETLAAAVTFFQVAIALTAIAVLARKKSFLGLASVLGVVGCAFMAKGFFF